MEPEDEVSVLAVFGGEKAEVTLERPCDAEMMLPVLVSVFADIPGDVVHVIGPKGPLILFGSAVEGWEEGLRSLERGDVLAIIDPRPVVDEDTASGRPRRGGALPGEGVVGEMDAAEALFEVSAGALGGGAFSRRVVSGAKHMRRYDSRMRQEAALRAIPVSRLFREAVELVGEGREAGLRWAMVLLRRLAHFFKHEFFEWVNAPACEHCGAETRGVGAEEPSAEERSRLLSSVVELYECGSCRRRTRFPRINEPMELLKTRKGRCGEWSNCFALLCIALGLETRHVHDWTDHVWVEVRHWARSRWVHVDPCEEAVDTPLLYEQGWGKKLSFVIAFGRDACVDVSRRYSSSPEYLVRASAISPSHIASQCVAAANAFLSASATSSRSRQKYITYLTALERAQLTADSLASPAVRAQGKLRGRKSGDLQWRIQRGEAGDRDGESGGTKDVFGWKKINIQWDEHLMEVASTTTTTATSSSSSLTSSSSPTSVRFSLGVFGEYLLVRDGDKWVMVRGDGVRVQGKMARKLEGTLMEIGAVCVAGEWEFGRLIAMNARGDAVMIETELHTESFNTAPIHTLNHSSVVPKSLHLVPITDTKSTLLLHTTTNTTFILIPSSTAEVPRWVEVEVAGGESTGGGEGGGGEGEVEVEEREGEEECVVCFGGCVWGTKNGWLCVKSDRLKVEFAERWDRLGPVLRPGVESVESGSWVGLMWLATDGRDADDRVVLSEEIAEHKRWPMTRAPRAPGIFQPITVLPTGAVMSDVHDAPPFAWTPDPSFKPLKPLPTPPHSTPQAMAFQAPATLFYVTSDGQVASTNLPTTLTSLPLPSTFPSISSSPLPQHKLLVSTDATLRFATLRAQGRSVQAAARVAIREHPAPSA